ncbi:MAG TPA: magnesium transporter [Dehalococcoidia bacterium]|nr:magnesium transporter [Dehalococcoidia bacterium]
MPSAASGETVAAVLARMKDVEERPACVGISDGGRFIGLVDATDLLSAEPTAAVDTLIRPAHAVVTASSKAERAAWVAAHAGAENVAVTDDAGHFLGVIPAHRLLQLMVHEHEIDLARMGGFLRGTRRARTASEEPIRRRIWHRAPWLLVGLAGAVVAAQIVRAFEGDLEGKLALAFFLPGIVYMADAVGTQTETLVIRGLSVGVSTRQILRLEAVTGALVGLLLSVAMFPLALAVTGDVRVAGVVAVSLFASSSCATMVAMTLPWILQHFDFDPAFGSGPLATVIQDLLSIVIYFVVASAVIQ